MASGEIPRDEAEAALAARGDLGADYEPAVVDHFVDEIDHVINKRVDERVRQVKAEGGIPVKQDNTRADHSLALTIVTMCVGVPLTAIAVSEGLIGILLVWAGLLGINALYAITNGLHRRS